MSVHIAGGFSGNTYVTRTPRIGYARIEGVVTPSTEAAGFAADNAANQRIDSFWRPTALPATWMLDAASAQSVSYVGIAGHDLGTQGCTVLVQSSPDGVAWTTRLTVVPVDDSAIFGLFASVLARYWRLSISGAADEPTLAVIQFGAVTEFPARAVYAPSQSFERSRNTVRSVNITEGGQPIGMTVIRKSLSPEMQVNHLSEQWVAANWDAFALFAETGFFFIADRPADYPRSCAYAWTTADLRAPRGLANAEAAIDVTLQLTGFLG